MQPLQTRSQAPTPVLRNDGPFLVAVVLWLALMAMIRPLTVPDEGRYADVARWMLVAHDWLTPRLNGLPFFHKPPLLYWVDASLFSVFGISPQVARLAPALAASLCCIGMFWFLRRRFGSAMARLATVILVTSSLFFGGAQYVNHDMLVGSGITLGILLFADGVLTGARRSYILAYLACGLAFMSKGMIGLALPGLVLLPWFLACGRWRQLPQVLNPIGLIVLVLVVAPWFYLAEQTYQGFVHYFFIDQQVKRYLTAGFNNKQGWWFYIAITVVFFLPWLFLAPLKGIWQRWVDLFGKELAALLVWWPVAVIGFFSIPESKLAGYIIPAMAPIAILLAGALQRVEVGPLRRLGGPLFLLLVSTALLVASAKHAGELTDTESQALVLAMGIMMLSALVLLLLVWRQRIQWLTGAALAAALWCVCIVTTVTIADHKNNSHDLAVGQYLTPGTQLVFYRHYYYDLPFLLNWGQAVAVVEDWPRVTSDSWGLELKDGSQFDAKAAQMLWQEPDLIRAMHSGQRLLVLAPPHGKAPELAQLHPVFHGRNFDAFLITGGH
jgi:4-amino-4-deoxy-L-arabinose transferase-like glycosyltransferase